jgi:hypothetical protein
MKAKSGGGELAGAMETGERKARHDAMRLRAEARKQHSAHSSENRNRRSENGAAVRIGRRHRDWKAHESAAAQDCAEPQRTKEENRNPTRAAARTLAHLAQRILGRRRHGLGKKPDLRKPSAFNKERNPEDGSEEDEQRRAEVRAQLQQRKTGPTDPAWRKITSAAGGALAEP